jgi:hypothetical protein
MRFNLKILELAFVLFLVFCQRNFNRKILEHAEEDVEALLHPAVAREDHALIRRDQDEKMLSIVRFQQMKLLPAEHSDLRPVVLSI